jgi:hypothetical protein
VEEEAEGFVWGARRLELSLDHVVQFTLIGHTSLDRTVILFGESIDSLWIIHAGSDPMAAQIGSGTVGILGMGKEGA